MEAQHVIGVAGPLRAGKGTVIKILKTIFGEEAHILSSSAVLEELMRGLGVPNPTERTAKQRGYVELAKRFGNEWLVTALANQWKAGGKSIWIFDGVCMPWDAAFIQSFPQWTFFVVDAPFEMRLERARSAAARGEHMAKPDELTMTAEKFREIHTHETARYIEGFKSIPGVDVLDNSGNVRTLGSQIITALVNKKLVSSDELARTKTALEELYQQIESLR